MWKVWQLISRAGLQVQPPQLTGDAEGAFVGNPSTFRKAPQAIKDCIRCSRPTADDPGDEGVVQARGFETTLQPRTPRLNKFSIFEHIRDRKKDSPDCHAVLQELLEVASIATNFRESVLRYAAVPRLPGADEGGPQGYAEELRCVHPEEIRAIRTFGIGRLPSQTNCSAHTIRYP